MTWTVDQIGEALRNYSPNMNSGVQGGGNTDWQGPPAWMLAGMRSGDTTVNAPLQLQLAQKYDPNAYLIPEDGFGTPARLVFDESKLPKQDKPGLVQFDAARDLKFQNPDAIYNDPNYGPMTVPNNATYTSSKPDWMSIVGPLLVGGFAGLAGGGLGLWGTLASKMPSVAAMLTNGLGGGGGKSTPFNNPTGPSSLASQQTMTPEQAALLRAMQTGQ